MSSSKPAASPPPPEPRFFTESELEAVSKYLIGNNVRLYPNIHVPQSGGPARVQAREELMMQRVMESCPFRGAMSFVVGGALGAFLGLFSSSMAPHQTEKMMTTRCRKVLILIFKNKF